MIALIDAGLGVEGTGEGKMLVLTRKVGQEIQIGEHIVIKVLGQQAGRVRLGIAAPPEVAIRREELAPLLADPWSPAGPPCEMVLEEMT